MDGSLDEEAPQRGYRPGMTRSRILQTLRQATERVGVKELAELLGLHANTVRFHLDRLVGEGAVARHTEPPGRPGRPRLTFTAVAPPGTHGDRRDYRMLTEILVSYVSGRMPDAAAAAKEAGREWGRYLTERPGPHRRTGETDAVRELMRILDDIGFAPELPRSEEGREIWLRHCPFLEVAKEHRDVVCGVHLGLMQGALEEMRATTTADRLEPLVEPSLCIAQLRRQVEPDASMAD